MLRNITIAARSTISFAVLALLVLAVGLYGLLQMSHIDDTTRRIERDGIPTAAALGAIREAVLGIRVNSLKLVFYPAKEMREDSSRRLDIQLRKLSDARTAYINSAVDPQEKAIYDRVKPYLEATEPGIRQLIELARQNEDTKMVDLLNGSLRENSEGAFPILYELSNLNTRNMATAFSAAQQTYSASRTDVIILIVFAALLTVVIAWLFSRSIIRPIGQALETAETVAAGNLTRPIETQGRDEITRLSSALGVMQSNLKNTIEEISRSAQVIATSSSQLRGVTAESNQNLVQQNNEIEQAATAVTQMTVAVEEVARNAVATSQASQDSLDSSEQGHNRVAQTIRAIESLEQDAGKSATLVEGLASSIQEIATVLDVIRGIAEQTNLLALNAAIEAARAGEAGRGFAVVADEVRALAHRTQQSTHEIEAMVSRIGDGSERAISAMKSSSRQATETLGIAQQSGTAISDIMANVTRINEQNLVIASAAEEQAQVAREVDRNLINIRDLSVVSTEQARQTAAASQELEQLGLSLTRLVAGFRT